MHSDTKQADESDVPVTDGVKDRSYGPQTDDVTCSQGPVTSRDWWTKQFLRAQGRPV